MKPSSKSGRDEHIIVGSVSCVSAGLLSRYGQEVHLIQCIDTTVPTLNMIAVSAIWFGTFVTLDVSQFVSSLIS